jgi:prepilin-type N-terminal cleavage/methylation domain-containing protein
MIQKNKSSGFSLIEMTIVIMIFGVLVATGVSFLTSYELQAQNKMVKDRLSALNVALQSHVERFGVLPCPSSLVALPGSKEFGQAMDCENQATSSRCAADQSYCIETGRSPKTLTNKNQTSARVRIGAIPARQINVPFDMTVDHWGNRIIYIVTENLAQTPKIFQDHDGAISVVDENGHSVITPEGSAAYVLISHGEDGIGAVSFNGGSVVAPCSNQKALDHENCNYRDSNTLSTFRAAFLSNTESDNRYDDFILYETKYANRIEQEKSCETYPICSPENIQTDNICRVTGSSDGLPLCTNRKDIISGSQKSDPYEHDVTTWKTACDIGPGWALPSLAELMNLKSRAQDIGNFSFGSYYLTRSHYNPSLVENEDRKSLVWALNFIAGSQPGHQETLINLSPRPGDKGKTGRIRCILR